MLIEEKQISVERYRVEERPGQWGEFTFEIYLGDGSTRFERVVSSTRLHIDDVCQCKKYVDTVMEWLKDPEGCLEEDPDNEDEESSSSDGSAPKKRKRTKKKKKSKPATPWHADFNAEKYSEEEGWDEFLENILEGLEQLDADNGSVTLNGDDDEDNDDWGVEDGRTIGIIRGLLYCEHAVTGINKWK